MRDEFLMRRIKKSSRTSAVRDDDVSCEHYGSMNIWHVKPAFVKNFLRHMDYKIALVRIGFCNVDLILLTGLAEVDNIGQIFRLLCREFL